MGGDEFIILLTRAEKQEALDIVARIGQKLAEKMKESRRALTMSVGLFACRDMCGSLDSMIAGADKLMYAVKSKGKNGVLFEEQ